MRKCICKQCGRDFLENDGNPAIHYSEPAEICIHCESLNELKDGEYYQAADGEYYKKGIPEVEQRNERLEAENQSLRKELWELKKRDIEQ